MRLPPAILLIEDSDDDQILMRRAFTRANLANPIYAVSDGDEATAYLSGEGKYADREAYPLPILILLDLKLPKRSGHELLQWLRAQPGLKRTPVAILTSSKQTIDINRAYDLGANAYLVKPVEFESLVELVHSLHLFWLILNEAPDIRAAES